jgi:RNA polymerase subunit RPABC4/transcription elongation factor Spt4
MFRASGPLSLSGYLFDPTSRAAAQIMTLAVCATCGSESDGEDLFCMGCGAFMDEGTVAESDGPACDDCGLVVKTGDLICPSCGSVSVVC